MRVKYNRESSFANKRIGMLTTLTPIQRKGKSRKRRSNSNTSTPKRTTATPTRTTATPRAGTLRDAVIKTSEKKGSRRRHTPAAPDYQTLKNDLRFPVLTLVDAAFCAVDPAKETDLWGSKGFQEGNFTDYALPVIDEIIGADASKATVRCLTSDTTFMFW